jgi:hypothetical protein
MTIASGFAAAGFIVQAATAAAPVPPPPPDAQIALAVLAAPADRRAGATVLGYDDKGSLVTLRKGTNEIVCLGDDPREKTIAVSCYHKDLEAFMARGRELTAQGVKGSEREEIRWKEIEAGKLAMPREPRSLQVLTASAFDAATGQAADAYTRWVVYTPFATPETTGLPAAPVPGGPWLMFPGKASAHIMINPARPKS